MEVDLFNTSDAHFRKDRWAEPYTRVSGSPVIYMFLRACMAEEGNCSGVLKSRTMALRMSAPSKFNGE